MGGVCSELDEGNINGLCDLEGEIMDTYKMIDKYNVTPHRTSNKQNILLEIGIQ